MSKLLKIIISIISFIIVLIVLITLIYKYEISSVSKESFEIEFEVKENSSYYSLSQSLKDYGLIKSELFYKIYVKLNKPTNLKKGKYMLNKNMNIESIIKKLGSDDVIVDTFVIPEGKHITDVAEILAKITDYKKEDYLTLWSDEIFLNKLIGKYWFITDEVKNPNLRYNLEGYFFPATYEIFKSASIEDITYKMLDKMDEVLTKYRNDIKGFTIHQILTLSSIVEYEAVLDEDRPLIAKVFLNRLNSGMLLQSCATVGYAINDWKLTYTYADLQTDSLYNTYVYKGLPIGPGGLSGEASIKAVIYPNDNDYLYFLANVFDKNDKKTYYSKTYEEHQQKCLQYLGKSC